MVNGKRKRIIKKVYQETVMLTQEEVQEITTTFNMFDKDGSGTIDTNELQLAMQALGIPTTRKEIVNFMEMADKDGSGTIEPDEFKRLMAGMIK